ncbi:hypothetical protein PILCRDRAFT_825183 [Piloderma croceum F 1598]|uniref:F-box domain-containing protein n=1 Tax=Piloderma croceum (strain F 1598) TaxID=765440 RepID=A0A0C3FDD0_PILCF|nr:hypothetical protein PILCRDRAFT_825183 [Piloderma croceum F 1598]
MQRCFRIVEILNNIFSFVSRPTLYALALTCRLFHASANPLPSIFVVIVTYR